MEVFTVPATVENPVFSPINDVIITQLDKISLSCGVEILTDMWDNADNILILRSMQKWLEYRVSHFTESCVS